MKSVHDAAKSKVLQEIMDLMDENDLASLKSKSPKAVAIEVDEKKPDAESMIDKVKAAMADPDHDGDDDSKEMPGHDPKEDDEDDDKRRLEELYARLR